MHEGCHFTFVHLFFGMVTSRPDNHDQISAWDYHSILAEMALKPEASRRKDVLSTPPGRY